ncbi:MAG: VanZ family protein [bacterium]|nr:VanZ family protein [bacterium]
MHKLKRIATKYLPSTLFLVFIGWIIYDADLGRDNLFLSIGEKVPFGDKFGHFFIFGLLCYLVNHIFNKKSLKIFNAKVYLASILVLSFAILEEFTQLAFEDRNFDVFDMICDVFGVAAFTILYNIKEMLIRIPKPVWKRIRREMLRGLY